MPSHREEKSLPYKAEEIFALVADIEAYPKFLPWTAAARIRSRAPIEGGEELHADLIISFKLFRERFGSKVRLFPHNGRIITEYLDGPFRHLISNWHVLPEGEGCRVHFDVDFEFKNIMLQKVVGLFFHEAMQRVVRAFEARAEELFSKT